MVQGQLCRCRTHHMQIPHQQFEHEIQSDTWRVFAVYETLIMSNRTDTRNGVTTQLWDVVSLCLCVASGGKSGTPHPKPVSICSVTLWQTGTTAKPTNTHTHTQQIHRQIKAERMLSKPFCSVYCLACHAKAIYCRFAPKIESGLCAFIDRQARQRVVEVGEGASGAGVGCAVVHGIIVNLPFNLRYADFKQCSHREIKL